MTRLIQALAIVAIGAVAQGCVHHNHGTRRVVAVHSEPVAYTSSIDYRYHGYHPVPHAHGGGWCNLNHVHVHHYEPLVSYGYTYYDSYNYWVYSRPRVVHYYGGHYDRHGRFCNHRGRHSHDYLPSTHAASAYSWDSRRNSYVYAPDRRSRAVRGVAPRATPPAGRGAGRQAPRATTRNSDHIPSVSPGNSGSRNVRSVGPRTSPGSSPRTSPSNNTPRVAPRSSPQTSPSNNTPRVSPRTSPSAPSPAVREAPRAAPRSRPSASPPAERSAPRATPRAAPSSSSSRPTPRAAPAARSASPRSAPAVSRPARSAPSRSVSSPGRPSSSRPTPRR